MTKVIQWGRHALGTLLPEGRFRAFLRSCVERYYDPLDNLVEDVRILENGSLLATLKKGIKFYARLDSAADTDYSPKKYRLLSWKHSLKGFLTFWYVLREIYVDNIYQKYCNVKRGDIVVDAGANIGVFTIKAAKAVGDEGMVIAIEPETNNFKLLKKNVQANGLSNVVCIRKGIWDSKSISKLAIKNECGHNSLLNIGDDDKFEECEVDRLDNILDELGVTKIDFIKMDIEGAEIEAARGMENTLKAGNVSLALEYHEVGGQPSSKKLAYWLKKLGYQVHINTGYKNVGMLYAMKL